MHLNSKTNFYSHNTYASRLIRAYQIADRLDCAVNEPPSGECKNLIFVKTFPVEIEELYRQYNIFVDVVDSDVIFPTLAKYPNIRVLAISRTAVDYIEARLENKVFYVPEHHCNFDNFIIPHRTAKIVGFVGYKECFDLPFDAVGFALDKLGLEFVCKFVDDSTTREDVVEFYKTIDIQLCFRSPRNIVGMPPELKNPLKIVNAASFGIPTVSYPEISYMREFSPYLTGRTIDDICSHIERVKKLDVDIRHQLVEKAKPYHIDKVVDIYRDMLGE